MNLLFGYQFGTLTEDERIAVEEKLLSSPRYLTEFFALKRSFEELPELKLKPSAGLKASLRADIARTLYQRSKVTGLRGFLTPGKYWALAASAAALVIVGVLVSHLTDFGARKAEAPVSAKQTKSWAVDSAEKVAVSLNYL